MLEKLVGSKTTKTIPAALVAESALAEGLALPEGM
jgi:hypothetical protein